MIFQVLLVMVVMVGQVQPPPTKGNKDLRVYILSRLIVDLGFDYVKLKEVEEKIEKMDEQQLRVLCQVYYERAKARETAEAAQLQAQQQLVMGQAQLNLEKAKAYRDHLAREYDRRIVQQKMEANLVRQHQLYLHQAMSSVSSRQSYGGHYDYGYRRNDYRWPQFYVRGGHVRVR